MQGGGSHNFWVDEPSGILYAAFYSGGVRALDVRGDLSACEGARHSDGRCDLGRMGRAAGYGLVDATPFVWGVAGTDAALFASDMNRGLYRLDITPLRR